MAWPAGGISTANLNSSSDSPAAARTELLAAVNAVNDIAGARGMAGGVAPLDDSGLLPTGVLPTAAALPPGIMLPYAGPTAPTGWLLCYGQAVSRTTYAALFLALGTTHGAGDGSTTFGLPDMRGRVPVGRDTMGGTAAGRMTTAGSGVDGATLGAVGGAETHTLTTPQIPSHTHGMSQAMPAITNGAGAVSRASSNTADKLSGTSDATGGGGAHNNTQPSLVANYIIKT